MPPVTTISVTSAARQIAGGLRAVGDPERARSVQRFFKEEVTALGIPAAVFRRLVREHARELRRQWTATEAIACCERLVTEPEMDVRAAGFELLGQFGPQLTPDLSTVAERWLEHRFDNWALVDGFCGTVLSPLLKRFPELDRALMQWSAAKSLWVRRASLVTLVPFARHGERLDLAYRLASEHFADPEDLMHKATGWLLREAGRTNRPRLKQYLLEHGPAIPRTTLRYAIEHFPAADRANLLARTRLHAEKAVRKETKPRRPGSDRVDPRRPKSRPRRSNPPSRARLD